jgi:formate dehydrogenase subunit gamma
MSPPDDEGAARPVATRRQPQLRRFSTGERWVHRSVAVLMGVLLLTAAILYLAPLAQLVGRRQLVAQIHVWAGLCLPFPVLVGWLRSRALRTDAALINRFSPDDWAWLRAKDRRSGRIAVGKFNAGQKLNGAFVLGAILVMLMTGSVMNWTSWWPLSWRTGATFVHDWLAFALVVVVAGHVYMANRDPVARLGMRTGLVPLSWARREHGSWAQSAPREPDLSTRAGAAGVSPPGSVSLDGPAGPGNAS